MLLFWFPDTFDPFIGLFVSSFAPSIYFSPFRLFLAGSSAFSTGLATVLPFRYVFCSLLRAGSSLLGGSGVVTGVGGIS